MGNHAVYFAKHFRQVHAFEPHPSIYEVMALNARWVGNVCPHAVGLGDVAGVFELSSDPTHLGLSSLKYGDTSTGVQVRVERLDDSSLNLSDLCFVKMDVEGFEANVIKGGSSTLAANQPIIVLEQHAGEFDDSGTESLRLLASLGYTFCWPHKEPAARLWIMRRVKELGAVLFGMKHAIVTAETVPKANYTMIIAVPPRFKAQLGLSQTTSA